MSSLAAQTIYTPEEYLALERKATFKNEYLNGEILAMSGASLAHTHITLDIATELNNQLRGWETSPAKQRRGTITSPYAIKLRLLEDEFSFFKINSNRVAVAEGAFEHLDG